MEKIIKATEERNWEVVFAEVVSKHIGCEVIADNIMDDSNGLYFYVKEKSLQENHPLILMHYSGFILVMLPVKDFCKLTLSEVTPEEYIDQAFWNFGYFIGGNHMIGGCFWMPLEDGAGMKDTEKISRYMTILKCRVWWHSSGYMPSNEDCLKCKIEHCPLSQNKLKKADASWGNEPEEYDYRIDLLKCVRECVKKKLKIDINSVYGHHKDTTILLIPINSKNECNIFLPAKLLNDILYHPGERDWDKIASEFKFELGVSRREDRCIADQNEASPEWCRDFWKQYEILDIWELWDARLKKVQAENALEIYRKNSNVSEDELVKLEAEVERAKEVAEFWEARFSDEKESFIRKLIKRVKKLLK